MKKNTVTQEQVDKIMEASEFDIKTIYGKVTVVTAKLPNGFTIVESSACVDPANYDEAIGVEICKKRIENEVWQLSGYLLQEQLYRNETSLRLVKFSQQSLVDEELERLQSTFYQG